MGSSKVAYEEAEEEKVMASVEAVDVEEASMAMAKEASVEAEFRED